MSNVPSLVGKIQQEAVYSRQPDSESLWSTAGGSINRLLDDDLREHVWTANGAYGLFSGVTGVDQQWVCYYNCTIVDAIISHKAAGTGGTTEIDIKYSTNQGSSWTSIFSTTPKIGSTAPAFGSCSVSQTLTGFTPGVFSSSPFNINAGTIFRMDMISAMSGGPRDVKLQLLLRAR
jgi:hypothetical protein